MVDGPPERGDDDNAKAQERRRLLQRLAVVAAGVVVLLVLVVLVVVVLPPRFTAHRTFDKDHEELKAQNDVRTTLLQGLGALVVLTGAAIGASVAYQGVRETRRQIAQTAADNQEQFTLTRQGQITDRYTKAVEQLGHEKALVRLGALYSLEHLAQDNPQYRQTVVDVVCAYLRMPYTPPAQTELDAEQVEEMAPPANGRDRAPHQAPRRDPAREEFQVRQTAQRLLADHLRRPRGAPQDVQLLPPSPRLPFWPGIRLELTGATLVDFGFARVSVINAQFGGATFQGDATFREATFEGVAAVFREATFQGNAWFSGATFQGFAWFTDATFQDTAGFEEATFQSTAGFEKATFQSTAIFDKATFQSTAGFEEATFQGFAQFTNATFHGGVWFEKGTFHRDAWFDKATFQGDVLFRNATFQSTALFGKGTFRSTALFDRTSFESAALFVEAAFHGDVLFDRATFQSTARFDKVSFQGATGFATTTFQDLPTFGEARVRLDSLDTHRVWPNGWTVHPDPTDPSRGTLVKG